MSIDRLRIECKLIVIRDCLNGLWTYAASAIERKDIGCLDYILKTGITPLVRDLEAMEGEDSIILSKEVHDFVQYVEMAMASIQLRVDTKQSLKQARETSYDQETDEFQRDVDMFIDGLDSDSD